MVGRVVKFIRAIAWDGLWNRHRDLAPRTWAPLGHYLSPIADLDDLRRRAGEIFDPDAPVPDIDLRLDDQRRLFETLAATAGRFAFTAAPDPQRRYHSGNDWFGPGDAAIYAALLLHTRPRRVIEVGSGFSSALLLDVNEACFSGNIACTFIEPYPDRLLSLLKPGDLERVRLVRERAQDAPLETFDALEAGDILFIDSSHVAKAGSDVNTLFFRVLPRLKPGVLIHLHDIFNAFEYPREWFFDGNRSWNELYLLRAFLMNNRDYRIVFFNSAYAHAAGARRDLMPQFWVNPGGGFWMVKM